MPIPVLTAPDERPAFVSPALPGLRVGEGLDPSAFAGKIVMINAWYEW